MSRTGWSPSSDAGRPRTANRLGSSTATLLEFPKRVPRWREIADSVVRDLRSASFADGRLTTEEALARRFGVNRHTVHRAIAALADRGLVRVEHGRGTFVRGDRADDGSPQHSRYTVNVLTEATELRCRLIRATRRPANAQTAKDFGITPGAAVIGDPGRTRRRTNELRGTPLPG
jgi:GntR family transcriptional regulator, phosphonate transport system regulatory protein